MIIFNLGSTFAEAGESFDQSNADCIYKWPMRTHFGYTTCQARTHSLPYKVDYNRKKVRGQRAQIGFVLVSGHSA